jgi:hypothetical protein
MQPATSCFHCGKPIPWLARLTGSRRFCSTEHARAHELQHSNRMLESLANARSPKGKIRPSANAGPVAKRPRVIIDASRPDPPRAAKLPVKMPAVRQGVKRPAVYMKAKFPLLPYTAQRRQLKPARPVYFAWFPPLAMPWKSRQVEARATGFIPLAAMPGMVAKLLPMAPPSEPFVAVEPSLIRPAAPRHSAQHTLLTDSLARLLDPVSTIPGTKAAVPSNPDVAGDPIRLSSVALARPLPPVRIDLRPSQPSERGMFVPRLRMSTLRPRISLGPKLDTFKTGGSVIPIAKHHSTPKYRTA